MKKTLYFFSDGQLARKDNTLYFESEKGRRFIPVENVGEIMAFGEIDVNKKLLELLSQKEILLHYFSYHGYYMGTFYPREHLNAGCVTLKQAEHYLTEDRRLALARLFVQGAAKNIRQVLKYYANRGKAVEERLANMEELQPGLAKAEDIPSLMALEAQFPESR